MRNSFFKILIYMFLIPSLIMLNGCFKDLPENFSTITDVYPQKETNIDDAPQGSFMKTSLRVPYEDAFRSATVAASQAQLATIDSDQDLGRILALRATAVNPLVRKGASQYYYLIKVKEVTSNETEITIVTKSEEKCKYATPVGLTLFTILTLGILLFFMPLIAMENSQCTDKSTLHYDVTSMPEITQFMNFVRNDLIAAGLL